MRHRGTTVTVTAAGEVLFMPGGQVHGWTRRFGNRAATFSRGFAPVNKRPRWGHYGAPLKDTIQSSPARFRGNGHDTQLVHVAVGSSAPHALYVDQGTRDFMAKILPPWTRNSPTLYEHTWRVPVSSTGRDGERTVEWEEVGRIHVRGQRAQNFFDRGLDRAFMSMLRRSAQVPSDPRVTRALRTWPTGLENFSGATPADAAFMASLTEWRAWRDEAWAAKRILGLGYNRMRERREREDVKESIRRRTGGTFESWQEQKARSRERSRRYRERQRAKAVKKPDRKKPEQIAHEQRQAAIKAERNRLVAGIQAKFGPNVRIVSMNHVRVNGTYVWQIRVIVRGAPKSFTNPSAVQ
jgi:hypothetical protein